MDSENDSNPDQLSLDVTSGDLSEDVQPDINTVTWSTDWTVSTIIDQLARDRFDLEPAFQRRDVWSEGKRSRFIESLLLGIPVPQVILAERKDHRGQFIVLDGKQRLRSLQRFAGLDGPPMRLSELDVLAQLSGLTYEELRTNPQFESYAAALENQAVRAVVLRGWTNESLLYLTFLRLNSNVVGLSPQELRRALHPGNFMNYVMQRSAESEEIKGFLKTKVPDFRMRDAELLIRHIALTLKIHEYRGNLRRFLDDVCYWANENWANVESQLVSCAEGLDHAMALTRKIFERNAFCRASARGYENRRNRAVLDIMAYYFQHENVRNEIEGHHHQVRQLFEHACRHNPEFSESLISTTKSVQSVYARLGNWGSLLSDLSPSAEKYIPR